MIIITYDKNGIINGRNKDNNNNRKRQFRHQVNSASDNFGISSTKVLMIFCQSTHVPSDLFFSNDSIIDTSWKELQIFKGIKMEIIFDKHSVNDFFLTLTEQK